MSIAKLLKYEPAFHVFFWLIVLVYPYIKYLERDGGYPMPFSHELTALVFNMAAVYFFYFIALPLPKRWQTIIAIITGFLIIARIHYYFDGFYHSSSSHPIWKEHISFFTRYLALSTVFFALYIFKKLYYKEEEIKNITLSKNKAELEALKAQINPHFLYNTLNTIYSSALHKEANTPELILKLSNSLRYLTEEGQKPTVSLQKEIKHLQAYSALQEERLGKKVDVQWNIKIDDEQEKIPPLLLIPIVENAFKYSSTLPGNGHHISFDIILHEKSFYFEAQNPFSKKSIAAMQESWKSNGIGLKNIEKRLKLLFPDRHSLQINQAADIFTVALKIKL